MFSMNEVLLTIILAHQNQK